MRHLFRALSTAAALTLAASTATALDELATFERCWELIGQHFYDDDHHGLNWPAVRERYRPRAARANGPEESRAVIEAMVAELKASHVALLEADVHDALMAELMGERRATFGLLLEETMPGRLFVRAAYESGPADRAGVDVGDRVVAVDGDAVFESPSLIDAGFDPGLPGTRLFFLRVPASGALTLTVQPTPLPSSRREVTLRARRMTGVDALRDGARVFQAGDLRIGVTHLWYCQNGAATALRDLLRGRLRDCDALVLDVRGRGGFPNVVEDVLNLFRPPSGRRSRTRRVWSKPVVFLTDDRTRSAKEILAQKVRDEKLGPLVGWRTEGAVLSAGFFELPDGRFLELAIGRARVGRLDLEGVGVAPDDEVDFPLPYSHGEDPILRRGLQIAAKLARTRRSRSL